MQAFPYKSTLCLINCSVNPCFQLHLLHFFFPWRYSSQWARAFSLSRPHDHAQVDTPHSVGLLWTNEKPVAETSTWQHMTHKRQTSIPPAGFEPAIAVSERLQTHALDRAATGIGDIYFSQINFIMKIVFGFIKCCTFYVIPLRRVRLIFIQQYNCSR